MPGPQSEYREIGNLYVESTPLLLELAVRTFDGTIALKREQAFELRDFLMRQFPGELGAANRYEHLRVERDEAHKAQRRVNPNSEVGLLPRRRERIRNLDDVTA